MLNGQQEVGRRYMYMHVLYIYYPIIFLQERFSRLNIEQSPSHSLYCRYLLSSREDNLHLWCYNTYYLQCPNYALMFIDSSFFHSFDWDGESVFFSDRISDTMQLTFTLQAIIKRLFRDCRTKVVFVGTSSLQQSLNITISDNASQSVTLQTIITY